jgi:hypothetical protein
MASTRLAAVNAPVILFFCNDRLNPVARGKPMYERASQAKILKGNLSNAYKYIFI